MTTVRLESARLSSARRHLDHLAERLDSARRAAVSGTPVTLATLVDHGTAHRAATWLAGQVAGLQTLEDLARLLETEGGKAVYEGTGTFADAKARIGPEISRLLSVLDPDNDADLQALAGLAGLLQRYSRDPKIEQVIVDKLGGSGLVDAFARLVPAGPGPDASPEEVAQWWRGLSPAQQFAISTVQCETIGNLDGVPFGVRDLSNRMSIPLYRKELLGMLDHPDSYTGVDPGFWPTLLFGTSSDFQVREKLRALDQIEELLGLQPPRQLLVLDPFDGQQLHAAVAVGDVDTADHVAVFTPGFTSTVQGSLKGYDRDMLSLQQLAARQSERYGEGSTVATITWMGYDAPQVNELTDWPRSVTMPALAQRGGDDLADFYAGINAARTDDPHLTALGHSYGSLTTGYALQHDGTGVDDAVLFGSPGTGTWHRSDLHVPSGHLYVAEADNDPVADFGGVAPFGVDPSHLPGVSFLSAHEADLPDGSHGSGSTGHSQYLDEESTSAYNLAVTVAGLPDRQVGEGAPPLFKDGRPTGDLYSTLPEGVHLGYEGAKETVEVTGEAVTWGVGKAWDTVKHFSLPDPVIKVPW